MSNKLPIIQYRSVKPQILIEVLVDPIRVNLVVHQGNFAWWQAEAEEAEEERKFAPPAPPACLSLLALLSCEFKF
jgi:hypothetical protein